MGSQRYLQAGCYAKVRRVFEMNNNVLHWLKTQQNEKKNPAVSLPALIDCCSVVFLGAKLESRERC